MVFICGRLHVSIENPVISIPLETSGKDQEPAVEIEAKRGPQAQVLLSRVCCMQFSNDSSLRRLVASNGPCRRQGRQGLVDALALHFEKDGFRVAGDEE